MEPYFNLEKYSIMEMPLLLFPIISSLNIQLDKNEKANSIRFSASFFIGPPVEVPEEEVDNQSKRREVYEETALLELIYEVTLDVGCDKLSIRRQNTA